MRVLAYTVILVIFPIAPTLAQDFQSDRELNVLRDIERNQRNQLELAREQAQRDSERAWRERNAYVNAQRDARSARRFDRH